MVTREIEASDLDFNIDAMTRPQKAPGRMARAGGFRVMRPTNRGPVCVAKVPSRDLAVRVALRNDWIEEVAA